MKIPYGVADFYSLRTEHNVYVDRTDRIRTLEDLGKSLLFLRPRRFGKSLWLSTLAAYYDLRHADEHERLFGDLAIGKSPTPLAHRFFVMRWDFSKINPDPPRRGIPSGVTSRHERLASEIHAYLNTSIETFLIDYQEYLPALSLGEDAFHNLERLLADIRRTPYRLYLLIDEYDSFANEVLTAQTSAYEDLARTDGPVKFLFKWVKAAMGLKGVDRLFFTGVLPMMMSDATSGMNIAKNVSFYPELNTLCGFTDEEVCGLLRNFHTVANEERNATGKPSWTVRDMQAVLRDWYNGYRFAVGAEETIYNPTLVFFFLKHLQSTGEAPQLKLASNLAPDEGKLDSLTRLAARHGMTGQNTLIDLIHRDKPIEVCHLLDRFTLKGLLDQPAQDMTFLSSYLYYFGMLTLSKEETAQRTFELEVPNEVVHGLWREAEAERWGCSATRWWRWASSDFHPPTVEESR